MLRKLALVFVAAASLGVAALASTPASAHGWHHGGWHHGHGGWHHGHGGWHHGWHRGWGVGPGIYLGAPYYYGGGYYGGCRVWVDRRGYRHRTCY